jgi:hypothetical protein
VALAAWSTILPASLFNVIATKLAGQFMAAIASSALLIAVMSGCTADSARPLPSATASPTLIDPLSQLTDPNESAYIAQHVPTVLHKRGTGPAEFSIEPLDASVESIRFFVACTPESRFTVTMSTFFSGRCGSQFQNTGEIPMSDPLDSQKVQLQIPADVHFWLVAVPVERNMEDNQ